VAISKGVGLESIWELAEDSRQDGKKDGEVTPLYRGDAFP
jgi:hypothetical protein